MVKDMLISEIALNKSHKSNYFLSLLLPFIAKMIIINIPLEIQKAKTFMRNKLKHG